MQSLQSFFISTLSHSERLNESDMQLVLGLGKRQSSAMISWISAMFGQTVSEQISDNGLAKTIKIVSIDDQVTITILQDFADSKIILNSSKVLKEFAQSFVTTEQFLSALEQIKSDYEASKS